MALIDRLSTIAGPFLAIMVLAALAMGASSDVGQITFETEELVIETASAEHRFTVEVARSPEQLAQGLMFRGHLADDHGMLFDFGQSRPVSMWMRNTYISLDMLFIAEDGRIHRIVEDTTPLSDESIRSNGPVRAVLELAAGTAARLGIASGDRVRHPIFAP